MNNKSKKLFKRCQSLLNNINPWDMEFEVEEKIIKDIESAINDKNEKTLLKAAQKLIKYIGDAKIENNKEARIINNIKSAMQDHTKSSITVRDCPYRKEAKHNKKDCIYCKESIF